MFESIHGESKPTHPLSAPLWLLAIFAGIQAACSVSQWALFEYRLYRVTEALEPFSKKLTEIGEGWEEQGKALQEHGKQLQDASERLAPRR